MNELEEIKQNCIRQMQEEKEQKLKENETLIKNFIGYCATKGLELTHDNFNYIQAIGIVACFPNIVQYICPTLQRDKEGLLDFNHLTNSYKKKPFGGYLYTDRFMLMAHPYFRRGLSECGDFAPRFIDIFWKFNHTDLKSYLAFDFDRVRINVDNRMCLYEDTWYGAKFSNQIDQISDGIVKLRPPLSVNDSIISFCFANAYALDIKWETKNGIKTFQSEEFKTEKIYLNKNGIQVFPAKYIHAEFDLSENIFRHFDGAIHFYTEKEYFDRRDSDFNYNEKNQYKIKAHSEKLFKLNGRISVETWVEFASHFLTGNMEFIEYIEGKYPDNITDLLNKLGDNSK